MSSTCLGQSDITRKLTPFTADLHASYAESRSLDVITLPRFVVAASIAVSHISAYNYHSTPMTGAKAYLKSGMTTANLCHHSLEILRSSCRSPYTDSDPQVYPFSNSLAKPNARPCQQTPPRSAVIQN